MARIFQVILWGLLLAACASLPTMPVPSPQKIMITPTESRPLYEAIERSDEAFNDGKLALTVRVKEMKCFSIAEPIPIVLVFENLTDEPLKLESNFIYSSKRMSANGNIFVWLTGPDGTPLLTLGDILPEDFLEPTRLPLRYQTLSGHSKLETEIAYQIPEQVLDGYATKSEPFTPTPGQYLLRVIYQSLASEQENEWEGLIASQRIELCVH
jgi:hypothetical protein